MNTTTKAQWIAQNLADYAAQDAAQAFGEQITQYKAANDSLKIKMDQVINEWAKRDALFSAYGY